MSTKAEAEAEHLCRLVLGTFGYKLDMEAPSHRENVAAVAEILGMKDSSKKAKPITCLCAVTNRADCPRHGTSEVARKVRVEERRAARKQSK